MWLKSVQNVYFIDHVTSFDFVVLVTLVIQENAVLLIEIFM
jgi:hypothetical protein